MSDGREDPTGGPPDDAASFEARLQAARTRRGLDPEPGPARLDKSQASALGVGLRVGVELVSALVVATAIGWGLDRWFGTMPLMICLFVLLGGAAGVVNVWRVMRPANGRGEGI